MPVGGKLRKASPNMNPDHHNSGMAALTRHGQDPAMLKRLLAVRKPARLAGAVGSRELFSMLCEALAEELQASDCLVSRWDPLRS